MKDVFNKLISRGMKIRCIGVCSNTDTAKYLGHDSKYEIEILGRHELDENFYRNLDAFLCLSTYEAYSLSTLEAMSLGIPVVSSDLNGVFHDFRDLHLARIDDITDTVAVSDMLEKVLYDEYFRNRIIASGCDIADRHTWEHVSKNYEHFYTTQL